MESKSFAELFEESLNENQARPGTVVSARVVAINDDYVILDAGLNSESSVPIEQFKNTAGELEIAVGDDVPVVLESIESGDGETVLSREKAKRNEAWAKIDEAFKNEESVTGIIEGKIKGGYTVQLGAIRAFLPGSLVDVRPVHDASYLEGKELQFKVIKFDQKRNNVVVSRRAVIEAETATEHANILANLQEGQIIDGIVKNLTDYGAFVDLGGVDGLLHIREMSWERVTNPSAIVNIGDEIKVKVVKFDREKQRISLSLKQFYKNPWTTLKKGDLVSGSIKTIKEFGIFITLENSIDGLARYNKIDWEYGQQEAQAKPGIARILEVDQEHSRLSLRLLDVAALIAYLQQIKDNNQLCQALQFIAQGLGLVESSNKQARETANQDRGKNFKRWFDLIEAVGSNQVRTAFEQEIAHQNLRWCHDLLLAVEDDTELLRACLKLLPAKISLHELASYRPLFSWFDYAPDTVLIAYRSSLQALLDQLLQEKSVHVQPRDLEFKLLTLNFKLEPKLYANITTQGNCAGEQSSEGDTEVALDLICSNLRALVRHEDLSSEEIRALEQAHLPQLLASMLKVYIQDHETLEWVQPWLHDNKIRSELTLELSQLLQPQAKATPQLLELDANAPQSLDLVALLPRKLRLAHNNLFLKGKLWADFVARELSPIIEPLTHDLTLDAVTECLALFGLRLYQDPVNLRRDAANKSPSPINWPPELEANLATAALALCWALSEYSISTKYQNLSTALLIQAPESLLNAVELLKEPDFAQLKDLLAPRLYLKITIPQRPWLNSLAQSLVHKLGCAGSQLTSTLDHYMVLGPDNLRSDFAQLVPLKSLSAFRPDDNHQLLGTEQYLALVLTTLKQVVTNRLNSNYQVPLNSSDFDATAHTPWQERRYLVYGALPCIKDRAPALYELLASNLQGAPKVLALSALPEVITTQLKTSSKTSFRILEESDLNAFMSLVMTTSELIAANYPVTYWGSLDDLSAIAPTNLSSYSLLFVGQDPQVLLESLAPEPLALNINRQFYQAHGCNDLAIALSTNYYDQLNIIEGQTAHALLQLHGKTGDLATEANILGEDEAETAARVPTCVILTRQLDGSHSLYILKLKVQEQLAAFEDYSVLDLSAQLWPSILQETISERPVKISYISTYKESKRNLPLAPWQLDENSVQPRSAEQESLIHRTSYSSHHRERYFAQQLYSLLQLNQSMDSDQALCYLIEYEGDVAPVCAYLNELNPQLTTRTTVLSLSSLLPKSLCSDLAQAQTGSTVTQASLNLPQGAAIVINSLEFDTHKLLTDLAGSSYQRLTIQNTLMELGLSSFATITDADNLQKLKDSLQTESTTDELLIQEQIINLVLLQGLLTVLYFKLGTASRSYSYYLLEPKLNKGLDLDVATSFSECFILESLYLKPFANTKVRNKAIAQAQPFFQHNKANQSNVLELLIDQEAEQTALAETKQVEAEPRLPESKAPVTSDVDTDSNKVYELQDEVVSPESEPSELHLPQQQPVIPINEVLAQLEGDGADSQYALKLAMRAISHMFIGGHAWRNNQAKALPVILKHQHDVLLSMPTGGGKSVMFQGPAWYRSYHSGYLTIVITPLKALMVDQIVALRAKNYLSVDYLSSDRPYHESRQAMQRLRDGTTTLLYITPERLRNRFFVHSLKLRYELDNRQGEYFVFDEAHCISQWGKEFRPDYIHAAQFVSKLRQHYNFKIIMCSATMTNQVITDLSQYLAADYKLLGDVEQDYNPIRPHIGLHTHPLNFINQKNQNKKERALFQLCIRVEAIINFIRENQIDFNKSRMLVFCQSRNSTEELCAILEKYAAYLLRMYHYQQQHPNQQFQQVPLFYVLQQLTSLNFPISPSTLAFESSDVSDVSDEDAQDEEFDETPNLFTTSSSALDQGLSVALNNTNSSIDYGPNDNTMFCDFAVIDPNDPILQLSQHMGFFHARMSANARDSVFTRYKEGSQQDISKIFANKNELWFVDNSILLEEPESNAERSLINSTQPIYLLFATKAFGMGMDIPNIHYVLHAAPTAVFEDYLQEVGRAGRSQEMYEAAFPVDDETGKREPLPAVCLYSYDDFDKIKYLTRQSFFEWDDLQRTDNNIRSYVEHFSSLEDAITIPVIVPEELSQLSLVLNYESSIITTSKKDDQNNKSALIYYYLELFDRIKLGFRGPCPIRLTLNRNAFMQMWFNANISLRDSKPWLKIGTRTRAYDPKEVLAQSMVMMTLKHMLDAYDEQQARAHTDDETVKQEAAVELIFDLQNFLHPVDDFLGEQPRVNQTNTLNAFIELMAAGLIKLRLPFAINFGKSAAKQREAEYYLARHQSQMPTISAPAFPLLTITIRVCQVILEQSYQDFCAELKRHQARSPNGRFDNSLAKVPLPKYKGKAFSNQWFENTVRELIAPIVEEFTNLKSTEQDSLGLAPWLGTPPKDSNQTPWDYYITHTLIKAVRCGVSNLLQQLPNIRFTKGKKQHTEHNSAKALMVKTWDQSFYLMLDLLYEDSWNLLAKIYYRKRKLELSSKESQFNPLDTTNNAKTTSEPTPILSKQELLKDWGNIIFMLGLRHESSTAVLDNYELHNSRSNAEQWYCTLSSISSALGTYQYFNTLLGFLQSLGLIQHSALVFSGYELNLTPESAALPMDTGTKQDSKFSKRYQKFEEIKQFKLLRLAPMEIYCCSLQDNERRKFIEEFFQSKNNSDYLKHIGNYSDEESDIIKEIRANKLKIEEAKLRSNPEQWAIYNAALDQNLNVMAGPGSGKTHILTLRCVRMIFTKNVNPESILVLAYNRAVVVELKARLNQIFTSLGMRKIGKRVAIFTFHGLAKVCLGAELNNVNTDQWEYSLVSRLREQPQLFINRFANLRYIMIDEFQDITRARLELLHIIKDIIKNQFGTQLTLFTIGDINQSIYGFSRIDNIIKDPEQAKYKKKGTISEQQYANALGPEPYYDDLNKLFTPETMSLTRSYRSFPDILAKAQPLALNPKYISHSAPWIAQYAPKRGYCVEFNCTAEDLRQEEKSPYRYRYYWNEDLISMLAAFQAKNRELQQQAEEAARQLKLKDREAIESYTQELLAAIPLSAASSDSSDDNAGETETAIAPQQTTNLSPDQRLLQSYFRTVHSIALLFRSNIEVYQALSEIRSLQEKEANLLQDIELHLQGSSSSALWRVREFYAIADFIKSKGDSTLNLSTNLMQQRQAEFNQDSQDDDDAQQALQIQTKSLMKRYDGVWDRRKLDMAYCMALSFSSTMSSNYSYTWADLYEYYIDLLSSGAERCYKIYDEMWHLHLEQKSKSITLTFTTIHKVKGLEYDMVIIPPSQSGFPFNQSEKEKKVRKESTYQPYNQQAPLTEDDKADLAEERRLYYVAYTRARKYLYIYKGEREVALENGQRFVAQEDPNALCETNDNINNYVISFNANKSQVGIDDYIAQKVKLNDPVVVFAQGNNCYIYHYADQNAKGKCIGMLAKNSKIKFKMQNSNPKINRVDGLFISNIIVYTYKETVDHDIRTIEAALGKQNIQQLNYDLTKEDIRNKVIRQHNIKDTYAKYWTQAAKNKGFCYLVIIAGRGQSNQSIPMPQWGMAQPIAQPTRPQQLQQVAPRPITRPVHANNWNRYRDNGRPNTARTPEDLLKDYSMY